MSEKKERNESSPRLIQVHYGQGATYELNARDRAEARQMAREFAVKGVLVKGPGETEQFISPAQIVRSVISFAGEAAPVVAPGAKKSKARK